MSSNYPLNRALIEILNAQTRLRAQIEIMLGRGLTAPEADVINQICSDLIDKYRDLLEQMGLGNQ